MLTLVYDAVALTCPQMDKQNQKKAKSSIMVLCKLLVEYVSERPHCTMKTHTETCKLKTLTADTDMVGEHV